MEAQSREKGEPTMSTTTFVPSFVKISQVSSEPPNRIRYVHRCSVAGCERIHNRKVVIRGVLHVMV